MSEVKNAVVIGKVNLPVKKEVVIQRAQKKPQADRPRRQSKDEQDKYGKNANGQMLAELQWVKKRLSAAEEQLKQVQTSQAQFTADVRALMQYLDGDDGIGARVGENQRADPRYVAVAQALKLPGF